MSATRHEIKEREVQGLKLFTGLSTLLEGLHEAGCARDRAGNRILHMDQYVMLILLYMFNPICVSLRSLQQASELRNVQKALGVPRTSLGSLSEATQVFDSALLIEIIGKLVDQLKPIPHDSRLDDLGAILTAVDGTLLPALPKMVWALWKDEDLNQPVRIVEVKCEPHRKRAKTGRGGPEQGETILLVTDRLDLPAEVVGLIFRHRWTVEIFFRFFKHVLGCRHLLSTKQEGIKLQTYAAIIACLLIALWTGRKPTLRTYEMICYYLMGWAEEDELLAHIAKLQKQN
jgi:hypothetical protein